MTTFIKLDEAARQLNVHKATLLRAIANGELQAVRPGRGYQTTQEWLDAYVKSLMVNTTKEVNSYYGTN